MCGTECRCEHFGLDHPNPRSFVEPQNGGASIIYLVYRVVVAVFYGFILIYSGIIYPDGVEWFVYLTYWTLTVLTLNVVMQAVLVLVRYSIHRKPVSEDGDSFPKKMSVVLKIVWVLQNVTLSTALLITVIYWTSIYDGWQLTLVDVSAHAVNSVYVVCDICVTGIPVRLLHFYQIFLYGAVYAIFSIIYWAAGGKNWEDKDYIYPILDYSDQPTTAAIWWLILFACAVAFHILMYAIYRLRVFLYSRCVRARVEPTSTQEVASSEINVTQL